MAYRPFIECSKLNRQEELRKNLQRIAAFLRWLDLIGDLRCAILAKNEQEFKLRKLRLYTENLDKKEKAESLNSAFRRLTIDY